MTNRSTYLKGLQVFASSPSPHQPLAARTYYVIVCNGLNRSARKRVRFHGRTTIFQDMCNTLHSP